MFHSGRTGKKRNEKEGNDCISVELWKCAHWMGISNDLEKDGSIGAWSGSCDASFVSNGG